MPNKDNIQINKADAVAKQLHRLYISTINDIVGSANNISIKENEPFDITKYPAFNRKVNDSLNKLTGNSVSVITQATEEQWMEAYEKNLDIAKPYLNRKLLTEAQQIAYKNKNLEALASFQKRKINGLKLSDRVWKYSNQFKGEIEMGIDVALTDGISSQKLSQTIQKYLEQPDKLFRRVRDKYGNLHLSKKAKQYSAGAGVYRSSYKNAMRLARTEVNMAYRASDYEKYQQFDFVVGIEVKRSNRVFGCSVCEGLKGKYPKSFRFVGWHPQCRCYTVPILNSIDKFIEQQQAILDGETYKPSNIISSLPKNFQNWYNDNKDKIKSAKSLPYFIKDNINAINKIKTKVVKNVVEKTKVVVEKVQEAKTYLYSKVQEIKDAMLSKQDADDAFRERCGNVWRSLTTEQKEAIFDYTGSSYAPINKSYYVGDVIDPRAKVIEDIIGKSWYDKTVVVRRGTDDYSMQGYFGIDFSEIRTKEAFEKVIGKQGVMKSFTSTGCADKAGFHKRYELFIECPPKTKMMYAEPFSAFSGDTVYQKWDGITPHKSKYFGSEQEIILQKGMKIEIKDIRLNPEAYSSTDVIQVYVRIID